MKSFGDEVKSAGTGLSTILFHENEVILNQEGFLLISSAGIHSVLSVGAIENSVEWRVRFM